MKDGFIYTVSHIIYTVSHIINPANVHFRVYSVDYTMIFPGHSTMYHVDAEFTVCSNTADQTLLTLNTALKNGTYSRIFTAFAGSNFKVTGSFGFYKIDRQSNQPQNARHLDIIQESGQVIYDCNISYRVLHHTLMFSVIQYQC
jgi:hypothetical protein